MSVYKYQKLVEERSNVDTEIASASLKKWYRISNSEKALNRPIAVDRTCQKCCTNAHFSGAAWRVHIHYHIIYGF